jgi:hypothetical protein
VPSKTTGCALTPAISTLAPAAIVTAGAASAVGDIDAATTFPNGAGAVAPGALPGKAGGESRSEAPSKKLTGFSAMPHPFNADAFVSATLSSWAWSARRLKELVYGAFSTMASQNVYSSAGANACSLRPTLETWFEEVVGEQCKDLRVVLSKEHPS